MRTLILILVALIPMFFGIKVQANSSASFALSAAALATATTANLQASENKKNSVRSGLIDADVSFVRVGWYDNGTVADSGEGCDASQRMEPKALLFKHYPTAEYIGLQIISNDSALLLFKQKQEGNSHGK